MISITTWEYDQFLILKNLNKNIQSPNVIDLFNLVLVNVIFHTNKMNNLVLPACLHSLQRMANFLQEVFWIGLMIISLSTTDLHSIAL